MKYKIMNDITMTERLQKINKLEKKISTLKHQNDDKVQDLYIQLNELYNVPHNKVPEYIKWTGDNEKDFYIFYHPDKIKYEKYYDKETKEPILYIDDSNFTFELSLGDFLCKEDGQIRLATRKEVSFILKHTDYHSKEHRKLLSLLSSSINFCNIKGEGCLSYYTKWTGQNFNEMIELLNPCFYKITNWCDKKESVLIFDKERKIQFEIPKNYIFVIGDNKRFNYDYRFPIKSYEVLSEKDFNQKYDKALDYDIENINEGDIYER